MTDEILVNVTQLETRVAVIEQGMLQDLFIERDARRGISGNIYLGMVVRVLPGMQAAFVDIGEERTGFIHASDIVPLNESGRGAKDRPPVNIADAVHEGKKIIVQVTKNPLGSKGARLTTQLSVSTRYLVLMPQSDHVGVSQLIADTGERARLQQLLSDIQAVSLMLYFLFSVS